MNGSRKSLTRCADCYRVNDLRDLKSKNIRFVSIEPIHEHISFWFSRKAIDWIILGAETGPLKGRIRPEKEWITSIIKNARAEGIALFIKENAGWEDKMREYPNVLRKETSPPHE